jgi:hypothetical protein
LIPSRAKLQERLKQHKAEPSHLLAADHAFKQRNAATAVELMASRNGREGIAHQAAVNGYESFAASVPAKSFKIRQMLHVIQDNGHWLKSVGLNYPGIFHCLESPSKVRLP